MRWSWTCKMPNIVQDRASIIPVFVRHAFIVFVGLSVPRPLDMWYILVHIFSQQVCQRLPLHFNKLWNSKILNVKTTNGQVWSGAPLSLWVEDIITLRNCFDTSWLCCNIENLKKQHQGVAEWQTIERNRKHPWFIGDVGMSAPALKALLLPRAKAEQHRLYSTQLPRWMCVRKHG